MRRILRINATMLIVLVLRNLKSDPHVFSRLLYLMVVVVVPHDFIVHFFLVVIAYILRGPSLVVVHKSIFFVKVYRSDFFNCVSIQTVGLVVGLRHWSIEKIVYFLVLAYQAWSF